MQNFFLWGLVGWGLSSWVLIHILWLPDPPPDWIKRFVTLSLAGILGGVAGGAAAATATVDFGAGIVGAISGALGVVAVLRGLSGRASSAR